MPTRPAPTSSDEQLTALLDRAHQAPTPETPEAEVLRRLRALLSSGATASAQRLARTLKHTYSYPAAMIAVAEAQRQAGQVAAARRTLATAQRQVQQFYEGDHWNGYPRAHYLLDLVHAQVAIGDPAGASQTAQLIYRPEYQALRAIAEQQ